MMHGFLLLAKARRVGLASLMVLMTCIAAAVWWENPLLVLQPEIYSPARAIGVAEAGSMLLAAVLPALSSAGSGANHVRAGLRSRLASTTLTAALAAATALPLLMWRFTLQNSQISLPGVWHVAGSAFTYASIGLTAHILAGRAVGPILATLVEAVVPTMQVVYPFTFIDALVSGGSRNAPDAVIVTAMFIGIIAVWHVRRGRPLRT